MGDILIWVPKELLEDKDIEWRDFNPFGFSPDTYDYTDAPDDKAGGADRNRGNAERLRRYWTTGPGGARIAWRTPGDFRRCVIELTEHLGPRAKGYCANRHKEMNGFWPGDRRNR